MAQRTFEEEHGRERDFAWGGGQSCANKLRPDCVMIPQAPVWAEGAGGSRLYVEWGHVDPRFGQLGPPVESLESGYPMFFCSLFS